MLAAHARRLCGIFKKRSEIYYNQNRSSGFIVLLPEVDPELADNLISVNNDLPAFAKLTTERLGMLMGKHIVDYECIVRNTDRKLEENPIAYPDVFEDALDVIEKPTCSFDTVCGIMRTLYRGDSKTMPAAVFYNFQSRIQAARMSRYLMDEIFDRCKKCDKSKVSEEQARLIEKHLVEGRLHGLDASPKFRGANNFKTLLMTEKMVQFRIRAEAARAQFYLTIDDPGLMRECPTYLLKMMSHIGGESAEGPWTVKLNYNIGEKFLEFCPTRDIRYMIWHAEDKAGSIVEDRRELANSVCLEEIRYLRYELGKTTGFKNFFEYKLCTKMAKSLEEVQSTLALFLDSAKPAQYDEVVKLQEFAQQNHFAHPIQLWDVPYWSRRQKKALFNFDDEHLRPYLTLENVLKGVFDLCGRLFGLRIEEAPGIDVWHPDVKFYYIFEPDFEKPVAGFYWDPYRRETKIRQNSAVGEVEVIRNSSRIPRPVMPLVALIFQLSPPSKKQPCLLSFSEAKAVFGKFGHALQYLLNKSSYSDVAGLNFVEFEATGVCQKFLADWIYDRKTFDCINGHYETGEKVTSQIDLEGVRKHMAGLRLCQEMFKAQMDIHMHTRHETFWVDLGKELWDDHFIFPMSKYFSAPCRYVDIFSGPWAASYYSHLWSEMLVADIRTAFAEEKDDASVGARFRDTFFTFGGSCHASEVFRRFRGRDPRPVSLLEDLGLMETIQSSSEKATTEDPKLIVTC